MNKNDLSKIHYNFCSLIMGDKELCGPYFNCLSVHYIINGIYCIKLKKGITTEKKGLNFVNNKITLAKLISDKANSLGLKHSLSFKNNDYSGFYFYVGCWQVETDIKKAKDYLTEINKSKKKLKPIKMTEFFKKEINEKNDDIIVGLSEECPF